MFVVWISTMFASGGQAGFDGLQQELYFGICDEAIEAWGTDFARSTSCPFDVDQAVLRRRFQKGCVAVARWHAK